MANSFENIIIQVSQRGADEAAKAIGLIGKESEKTTGALAALNRIMYTVAGAISAKQLTDTISAYQSLTNQLRLVTKSADELSKTQERLFKMAQNNRTSLEDLTDLYSKLALSQKEIGISGDRLFKVTDLITKALANNGKGSQAAAAGLKQLIQGLQSGRLAGEELKSVLENTPYLANTLAKGLNVPLGKLREMGAAGELTADKVVKAFERMGSSIEADFKKMDVTISQALTVLDNAWKQFIGSTSEATGVSKLISSTIVGLANNLGTVVIAIGAATAAWIAYRIAVTTVTVAMAAANLIMNANPILRLVSILLTAGALLVAFSGNIGTVTKYMTELGKTVWEVFKSIATGVTDAITFINDMGTAFTTTGNTISTNFNAAIQSVWDFIKGWYDWLVDLITARIPDAFKSGIDSIYNFFNSGFTKIKDFVLSIFDSIRSALNSFVAWAQNIINSVVTAAERALAVVRSIGGGSSASQIDGQRAAGGPVSGGKTYLVGEEGPELFVPGSSGTIVPNGGSGDSMSSSGGSSSRVNPMRMLQQALATTLGTQLVALNDLAVEHGKKLDTLIELADKIASSVSATNNTVQQSAANASSSGSPAGTSAINNYVQNGMTTTANTVGSEPGAFGGAMGGGGGSVGGGGGKASAEYGNINMYARELSKLMARYQRNFWHDPQMQNSQTRNSYAALQNYRDQIPQSIAQVVEDTANRMLQPVLNGEVRARSGTDFLVGGHTGVDSKVIPLRATPGERVTVQTQKQQRDAEQAGGGGGVNNFIFQISTKDADSFRQSKTQILREFSRDLAGALRKD